MSRLTSEEPSARVLVVDDSAFMRSRIKRQLIEAGMEIAGEARDGGEAARLYEELRPDLVTMDLTMRGQDGLEGARLIRAFDPEAKIVIFSIIEDKSMADQAREAGAIDCIHKGRPRELVKCLQGLIGGSIESE